MFSAFVSGAEVSYFSLNMSDLEKLKEKNEKNKLIYELIKNPNSLLATILIAKNFINIAITTSSGTFSDKFSYNISREHFT